LLGVTKIKREALSPVLRLRYVYVANKLAIVCPAQFGTHCVPNWEAQIKCTHIAKISNVKTFTELLRQSVGKLLQLLLAIGCAAVALLFMFDNQAADLPITLHHGLIDSLPHMLVRLLDDCCDVLIKQLHIIRRRLNDVLRIAQATPPVPELILGAF